MKPVPMHPDLPEATTALGTVVKPKQWVECAHCKKLSPLEERKWQSLTDDELHGLHSELKAQCMGATHPVGMYRVLEKALKEKNT